MFENTLNAMENPIKTIKGIGKALTIKTGKAIYASVKDVVINDIINGNTNTRSKIAGKAVLELGVSIIGAKALDKTLKAGKFSGAGRLSNYIDEIGRYSDDVIKGAGKAKGLVGKEFEDFLEKQLGGKDSFKVGGREFDGAVGDVWYEAKSGQYWNFLISNEKNIMKFKSDMGHRLKIAIENGAKYELHSNTPIP